jgi:hypothetical protein
MAPECQFDDCDATTEAPAVAAVPLVSAGMTRPYAWVLSCASCTEVWRRANEDQAYYALELRA